MKMINYQYRVFWSVMPDLRSLPRTRYGGIQRSLKRLDSCFRRHFKWVFNFTFDAFYLNLKSSLKS
jgi:hypothetical protein